jgi:hypothetical protein
MPEKVLHKVVFVAPDWNMLSETGYHEDVVYVTNTQLGYIDPQDEGTAVDPLDLVEPELDDTSVDDEPEETEAILPAEEAVDEDEVEDTETEEDEFEEEEPEEPEEEDTDDSDEDEPTDDETEETEEVEESELVFEPEIAFTYGWSKPGWSRAR